MYFESTFGAFFISTVLCPKQTTGVLGTTQASPAGASRVSMTSPCFGTPRFVHPLYPSESVC